MKNIVKTTAILVSSLPGLAACMAMNEPLGDHFGVAVETNKQAHTVRAEPVSSEQPRQSGAKAADAIERYRAGPQTISETTTNAPPSE